MAVVHDLENFRQLVLASEGEIRAFIAGWGIPASDVDDLAQEVYLQYYQQASGRPPGVAEVAWLKGIARNLCRDHVRTKQRHGRHLAILGQMLDQLHGNQASQSDDDLNIEGLRSCFETLNDDQREMLTRRHCDGQSSPEIAAAMGRRDGTVRMTLMRLRERLRDCVERRLGRKRAAS